MVFPVVMYGCESWTVKKAVRQRIDAFELWCWRRLLQVPWTARHQAPPSMGFSRQEYWSGVSCLENPRDGGAWWAAVYLLAVQGTCKSLLQHHSSKVSILRCSAFFTVQLSHPYMTTGKTIALTAACSCPGENARSWEALGEARPGQSSLSAGALRYRAWAHSWMFRLSSFFLSPR